MRLHNWSAGTLFFFFKYTPVWALFHYEYRILGCKPKSVAHCSTLIIFNMFIDKRMFHHFTGVVKNRPGLAALNIKINNVIDSLLMKCKRLKVVRENLAKPLRRHVTMNYYEVSTQSAAHRYCVHMYVFDCLWLWVGFPVEWHMSNCCERPITQIIKAPEMACIKQHNLLFVSGLHFGEILERKENNLSCGNTLIFWCGSSRLPAFGRVPLVKEETRKI